MSRRVGAAAFALAGVLATVVAPRATAATSVITTVAGGPGYGRATNLAQRPNGLAVAGNTLYVSDTTGAAPWGETAAVRAVDLTTGVERVVAGNGRYGRTADGVPATSTRVARPSGVTVDGTGELYFTDEDTNSLQEVGGDGVVKSLAGMPPGQYDVGDGGPAKAAGLLQPWDVKVDAAGNLYIADTGANRIRRIDAASGIITTIAGLGGIGFGGDGGPATAAELSGPTSIALGPAGAIYIADSGNHRIRKVGPDGVITTVVGGDTWVVPQSIALDATGALYFTDDTKVRMLDAAGVVHDVAGNGATSRAADGSGADVPEGVPALTSPLLPTALAFDAQGNLYVADVQRVRRIDAHGVITTMAGNGTANLGGDGGPATDAQLLAPTAVMVDRAGNLFIGDTNNRIRKVDPSGVISSIAGKGHPKDVSGDGGPATQAGLVDVSGFAQDAAGNLYFSDWDRVRRIDAAGVVTTFAGGAIDYHAVGDGGPATAAFVGGPQGLTFDLAGNLYIAELWGRIRRVDRAGVITTVAGGGAPADQVGDGVPATQAELKGPSAVQFDGSGRMLILDRRAGRVRRVDTNGVISTVAGGGFTNPPPGDGGPATATWLTITGHTGGLAVDAAGNIFIVEAADGRVRKVDANGVITTIAGTARGLGGDGGPAASALFDIPVDAALDGAGNLYITDARNDRVRKITNAGAPRAVPATEPAWLATGTLPPVTAAQPSTTWSQPTAAPLDGIGSWVVPVNDPHATPGQPPPAYFYAHQFSFTGSAAKGAVGLAVGPAGKFAVISVRGPDGAVHNAVAPLAWKAGHAYFPLVYQLGAGVWGAWVFDYDTGAWAGIGLLSLPPEWGKLAGTSSTTVAWIGAPASACTGYAYTEAFNYPPTGYRAGIAATSTQVAYGPNAGACAGPTAADNPPWVHYFVGAGV